MKIGVLGFMLSMPLLTSAYFYRLDVLKKSNSVIKALSDYHDKDHPATHEQRHYIQNYLAHCCPARTKIIVEDLNSLTQDSLPEGILTGLAQHGSDCGLCITNVEYRLLRVKALGEFVYHTHKDPYLCKAACTTLVSDLVAEITTALDKVTKASFPLSLRAMVHAIVADIQKVIVDLGLLSKRNISVAEYLAAIPQEKRCVLVKKILMCDVKLLDLHIVLTILEQPQYENIIICAGGSHIEFVTHLLKKMGYYSCGSTKASFFTETDLSRCVTATIYNNSYCLKPHPVNLKLLEQW